MSHALISRNADLQNLLDDGFEIEIVGSYLVVHSIPYVNATSEIKFGRLISDLDLAGDRTVQPKCHTVRFSGDIPAVTMASH